MQYLDTGNDKMRLQSLYSGPTFMTHHRSYAAVQNSSLMTPPSSSAPAASTSTPNNFREFRTNAANSQLNGNVPPRQDVVASTSHVSSHGNTCQKNVMTGTGHVMRHVGSSPDGIYRNTVTQGSSGPSLTSPEPKLNLQGNSSVMPSPVSSACNHATHTKTSSYIGQPAHNLQVNMDQQIKRAFQLRENRQHLLMYHHAMVCRKREACGFPMCAQLKRTLEHAANCRITNCPRRCSIIRKLINHFMGCENPRCPLCGPVKEIILTRGATIDKEESRRRESPASDEPEPKRIRTYQHDGMICDVSTDFKNKHNTKVVSNGESAMESRAEAVISKELDCSVNETVKEPVSTVVVNFAIDEEFAKEVKVNTTEVVVINDSYNGDGTEPVEQVKDSDTLLTRKMIRTDQHDRMICDVSTDLTNEHTTKVVSNGESVMESRAEAIIAKELDCSVNETAKEPVVSTLVVNSAIDEEFSEEVKVNTTELVVGKESDIEDGTEPVEQVKDSDPLNGISENRMMSELQKNVDSCANLTVEETSNEMARGTSLLYTFTLEEMNIHLSSLRLNEKKTEVTNEQLQLLQVEDQNTCTLCGMKELLFAPQPRYCGKCDTLIQSHGVYYCTSEVGNKGRDLPNSVPISLCSKCYNVSGELVKLPSGDIPKFYFQKWLNYAETDADSEWWVQCSKCEAWQHQICALFNGRRNQDNLEFTCVACFVKEIENGKWKSLAPIKVLGACDLPRTMLSDHIEKWLFTHLEIEKEERAANLGKKVEEVPGVEGLCVRVVSSIDRIAYVKTKFQEFNKDKNYPSKFPYKSKAIVLFQKIEGVDVCLFAMYVQEYGSQCPLPNQRHTYISYIDSVKYFRPEIRSSTGEALRTFVYHGILIAYLDYCKKRGFVSCSLWACPPTKHDDYIFYCHPPSQKKPKAEKLRAWYHAMIAKALKKNVVVERTNLYDYYLIPTNDWKTSVSAAHLPYCDNDFWPGEAEDILLNTEKSGAQKKETEPQGRAMRAAKRGLIECKPDDIMLLHKLGERMRSLKEDFILIYLQPTCKHCRHAIVSGTRWVCTSCKNFLLCDLCYNEEEVLHPKDKHPANSKFKHEFHKVIELALPATDDPDPCRECEFFDSRIDLLNLCQKKTYQFDTLRRAKHTSMMLLHHLHTPSCSSCNTELEPDKISWVCPTCPRYYMCGSCYGQGVWEIAHDHELVRLCEKVADAGIETHIEKETKLTFHQLALETLLHSSQCIGVGCENKLCRKMKQLFRHGVQCKVRIRGGCLMCKKIWYVMKLHCCSCEDLDCKIGRCREIKDHISKLKIHPGS